jgi:hypothetical protein
MKSRRFMFVVLVGVLIVAALVAGHASEATAPATASGATTAPGAAVVAQSSPVWFCPGLPSALPHGSGRVTFANIGDSAADVVVTDLADSGKSTHLSLSVPSRSVVARTRDQLGAAGALTVETFGGRVLVEEGLQGGVGLETTPCATQASAHWYFAAGSTLRGVQQFLVIDNPYASDARVDVTLRTSSGTLRPDALQALDIARRSREVVAIHDVAVRQDRVAVEVDTEVGAVVAAQALVYTDAAPPTEVAFSLGIPATATDWEFSGGIAEPNSNAVVAIANVGSDDAQVDVQATAELSKGTIAPASLAIAQDSVAWVTVGECTAVSGKACIKIPPRVRYSLDVRSEQNVAIVAQSLTRFGARGTLVGSLTVPGAIAPARSWAFARSRVDGEVSTTVSVFNPEATAATVDIGLVGGGTVARPRTLQKIKVPPGRAVTVTVVGGRKPSPNDAAITIDADQPVFATRLIATSAQAAGALGVVTGS